MSVEPVSLGTPRLAWNCDAGRVDHIDFDTTCMQSTRQPETVTLGLERNNYPLHNFADSAGFLAPYIGLFEQATFVNRQLLQWTAIDTRNNRQYQPRRPAHLDDGD